MARVIGGINGVDVLFDQATGQVFDVERQREIGKLFGGKFTPRVDFLGDPRSSKMSGGRLDEGADTPGEVAVSARKQEMLNPELQRMHSPPPTPDYGAVEAQPKPALAAPAAPVAAKPKFNMARAKTFTGEGGYKYAYDPETNVIAILESNGKPKASPVYVRPDGKFQDAHKAIMAEYRASMSPANTREAPVEEALTQTPPSSAAPPTTTSEPTKKLRQPKSFLKNLLNSNASDIKSSDI